MRASSDTAIAVQKVLSDRDMEFFGRVLLPESAAIARTAADTTGRCLVLSSVALPEEALSAQAEDDNEHTTLQMRVGGELAPWLSLCTLLPASPRQVTCVVVMSGSVGVLPLRFLLIVLLCAALRPTSSTHPHASHPYTYPQPVFAFPCGGRP